MRVRDHVAVATAGAVVLRRLLGRGGLGFWAGSVLIDADHYLWYFVTKRNLDPVAAVRFFNGADGPQHSATRVLHSPESLLLVSLLAARVRRLRPVAAGMCLHAVLDSAHRTRMDASRDAALARDSGRCQACGTSAGQIRAHLARQPWLGPSYRVENLISLCAPCHEAAHATVRWAGRRGWLPMMLPVFYLVGITRSPGSNRRSPLWQISCTGTRVRKEESATWTS